jgi:branched-chain amino acid transport system ATP-binding protein
MLEVEDLHIEYGGITALRGVNLSVPSGSVVGVVGRNGAGKSSMVNAIAGLIRPSSGSISFGGERVDRRSAAYVARRGLNLVPEERRIFADMTVRENLVAASWDSHQGTKSQLEFVVSLFPVLGERMTQEAGTMSGGQQQMLAIARALMMRPKLLILDEPSLGLAPIVVGDVFRALAELATLGQGMLLIEQNTQLTFAATSYCYILNNGEVIREGTSAELSQHDDLISLYF